MTRLFLFSLITSFVAVAQPSVAVQQAFLDLTNDGVIMCVSAHPDDEDGATLAYYRMKYGVKTYSVFLTRGEGGQNEKGPELYEELGVLRTAETGAAGRIQETEVHFLNFKDFGYSKTATEAFQKWGRDEVIRRLVYIIRKLKPDVIFSNLNPLDGHGHHQAAAVATIAAFDAAADSTYAPEQLKLPEITIWQPKKFYIRTINRPELGYGDWGKYDVANNITEVNAARGMDYVDIATMALHMHRTQGMERADARRFTRGQSRYKLVRESSLFERDTTSFFGGIDLWDDPALQPLRQVRSVLSTISPDLPQDSLLRIASSILKEVQSFKSAEKLSPLGKRMLGHWRQELERVVSLVCNIDASLALADTIIVPRQRVNCELALSSPRCMIGSVKIGFVLPEGWAVSEASGAAPQFGKNLYSRDYILTVGEAPILTLPKASAQYRPIETDQEVAAIVNCSINGYPFVLTVPAKFDVAPPQTLTVLPSVSRMSSSTLTAGRSFEYAVKNYRPGLMAGRVSAQVPKGWNASSSEYRIEREDSVARGTILVRAPEDAKPGDYRVRFKTEFTTQDVTVRIFDVKVAKDVRLGIIKSYDNTLEAAASEIGVPYELLARKDLESSLSRYTTIVIDIRAYLVRDDLKAHMSRLLEYVKDGGNLVVMYQRPQEWKPEYSPFPFHISDKRVTFEDAPVDVLEPRHPLFNAPNVIGPDAWVDWKQERAIYLPTDVPFQFTRLLSSHDPDETPLTTGYIVARYGKGSYIYTSYVWYRQLKEEHAGAFRCFANMISYPSFRGNK